MRLLARAKDRGAPWCARCPPGMLSTSRLRGRARDLLLRDPERGILRPRLPRHVAHRRIEPEAVRDRSPPGMLSTSRLRGRARDLLLRDPERGILRPRLPRHVAHRRIEPEAV